MAQERNGSLTGEACMYWIGSGCGVVERKGTGRSYSEVYQ